jgi:uncharacterized repeat protein (TIGR01451 family)
MPVLAAAAVTLIPLAAAAEAVVPSSVVEVSPTTVQPGQTFTVTQTVTNTDSSTMTNAKPAIYGNPTSIVDVTDLVSCSGNTAPCFPFGSSYRAPVGDLGAGESRTVVFTLRVKDTAASGSFTLQHQLVGDNFSFQILDGPVITIQPSKADVGVSLDAAVRPGLLPDIDYTLTVANLGPATATGIRVVATYKDGLQIVSTTGCVRVPGTRTLNCDIASLPSGATATAKFTADPELLAIGPFTTSVQRQQSSPADPNPDNDHADKTCSLLTGLLVRC